MKSIEEYGIIFPLEPYEYTTQDYYSGSKGKNKLQKQLAQLEKLSKEDKAKLAAYRKKWIDTM